MKTHHRLGYARLAEALAESGLVDQKALKEALQYSSTVGTAFPEAIVESNLVTDWDLSRVVCELFGLPFLPVEVMDPDPGAFKGLDLNFMRENRLIPMGRFGQVLTVCMPGLVEADTLGLLSAQTDLFIIPVVGSVRSNRHWLEMNIEPAPTLATSAEEAAEFSNGWDSFFDEADAKVLMDLQATVEDDLAVLDEPVHDAADPEEREPELSDLPPPLPRALPKALPELPDATRPVDGPRQGRAS